MSIQISATNSKSFSDIEQILNKFDKDFINNFNTAEYAISGFNDIKLVSTHYFNEKIVLPDGFVIKEIKNKAYSEYEKTSDGNIKENPRYGITINATFKDQVFILVYLNIVNVNFEIRV